MSGEQQPLPSLNPNEQIFMGVLNKYFKIFQELPVQKQDNEIAQIMDRMCTRTQEKLSEKQRVMKADEQTETTPKI